MWLRATKFRATARLVALAAVLAALAAGCGEDSRQSRARVSVESFARGFDGGAGRYRLGTARCTRSRRVGFVQVARTRLFICSVRLRQGQCDFFEATLRRDRFVVTLLRRDDDCVLPL